MTYQQTIHTSSTAGLTLVAFAVGSLSTMSDVSPSAPLFTAYQHEGIQSSSAIVDFGEPDVWKYDTSSQQFYFVPVLHQTEAAKQFVEKSEEVKQVLQNLQEKLKIYFGAKPLMLELVHDPESGEDGLLLSVMVKSDIDSACEALRHFEDDWWLDQIGDAQRLFSVDVMPV